MFATAATVVAISMPAVARGNWHLWRARSGGTRDGDGVDGSRGGDDAGDGTSRANYRLRCVLTPASQSPSATRGQAAAFCARMRARRPWRGCARGAPEHGRAAPRH